MRLAKAGELAGADAGIDLTERVIGASPAASGCSSSRELRPFGEWTAPIEGSSAAFSFNTSRTSSNQTTTIHFEGSLVNNLITGTLRYTRSSSALVGGTAGTSLGTVSIPVSIQLAPAPQATTSGTWTGTLTFTIGGANVSRPTTLTLTQSSGSMASGQLQFAGGEIDDVSATIAGSTLAITATPRPNDDACPQYSFGIVFLIDANQLRATNATGIACESGGKTLRDFTAASGTLTRSP